MGKVGPEAAQTTINEIGLPLTVDQYIKELEPIYSEVFQNVDFMPGAVRLIQHLHKHKVPQAIATSSSRRNFDIKTKKHHEIFEEGKYFHHIVVASDDPEIQFGKPHPQTFLVCAQRFVPPVDPAKASGFFLCDLDLSNSFPLELLGSGFRRFSQRCQSCPRCWNAVRSSARSRYTEVQ